jgi:hypothetical protein
MVRKRSGQLAFDLHRGAGTAWTPARSGARVRAQPRDRPHREANGKLRNVLKDFPATHKTQANCQIREAVTHAETYESTATPLSFSQASI